MYVRAGVCGRGQVDMDKNVSGAGPDVVKQLNVGRRTSQAHTLERWAGVPRGLPEGLKTHATFDVVISLPNEVRGGG